MAENTNSIGKVTQVLGAVVDVQFEGDQIGRAHV